MELVYRFLALPIVMAGAQLWTLLLLGLIAYGLFSWTEVDPFQIVLFGLIAFFGITLAVAAVHLGSPGMARAILAVAGFLIWKAEQVVRDTQPENQSYRMAEAIPVAFSFRVTDHAVYGTVLNQSSDWLESARAECQGFFANGDPVEEPWTKGLIGSHWTAPGESMPEQELKGFAFMDPERFDFARTSCRITEAKFREAPTVTPSFSMSLSEKSGYATFTVLNDTGRTITQVFFSCKDENGRRLEVWTTPKFQTKIAYSIEPSRMLDLISDRAFFGLSSCRIYSVKTL